MQKKRSFQNAKEAVSFLRCAFFAVRSLAYSPLFLPFVIGFCIYVIIILHRFAVLLLLFCDVLPLCFYHSAPFWCYAFIILYRFAVFLVFGGKGGVCKQKATFLLNFINFVDIACAL